VKEFLPGDIYKIKGLLGCVRLAVWSVLPGSGCRNLGIQRRLALGGTCPPSGDLEADST